MTSSDERRTREGTVEDIRGCCGCGTCEGMCPTGAVSLVDDSATGMPLPTVDGDSCIKCGLCLKVCPVEWLSAGTDVRAWRSGRDGPEVLLGEVVGCYIGSASDPKLRREGSSGGLVTALSSYALESGSVDGVVVIRMNEADPTRAEPFIARSGDELLGAAKSKYCPTSTNTMLREILDSDGRFAVVGLPCQMRGLELACRADESLRAKVALRLGLFCSHTLNSHSMDFVLRKLGTRREDVRSISYRSGGWPGSIRIELRDGTVKEFPLNSPIWRSAFGSFVFTPECCQRCNDLIAEQADISFGDPWLPEVVATETEGISIAVSHTAAGQDMVNRAVEAGVVSLRPASTDDVIASQRRFLGFKKLEMDSRVRSGGRHRIMSLCPVAASRLGRSALFRSVLGRVPAGLIDMLVGVYYLVFDRSLTGRLEVRRDER